MRLQGIRFSNGNFLVEQIPFAYIVKKKKSIKQTETFCSLLINKDFEKVVIRRQKKNKLKSNLK